MIKKTLLVREDNQNMYNKWVSGIAKREAPPEVITVADIQNRFRNDLNYKAPLELPYPLTRLLDFLGNLFIKSAELRRLLGNAINYPIYRKDSKKIEAIKSLNSKIDNIQKIIYSCTDDLNKLLNSDKESI
jgi:hypothetical protein